MMGVVTAVALYLTVGVAGDAATLEDFQKAEAATSPCERIPYETLRKTCINLRADVEDYCKTGGRCDGLDVYHKSLLLKKSELRKSELESQISDLTSQRDSAPDDATKEKIERALKDANEEKAEREKSIKELPPIISDYKYRATGLEEKAGRCIQARKDQMQTFIDARAAASSEHEEKTKEIAERLIREWNDSISEHETPLIDAERMRLKCEKASRGEEPPPP
jgi:hypothetical protein